MSRKEQERRLATRLAPVSRAWQQLADQALAGLGISNSAGWCLVYIERLGEDVRQTDLARAVDVTQASLARTLHQLEAWELVDRIPDRQDKRANNLRLTDKGRSLTIAIEERLVALRSELLAQVPAEDLTAALRVFDALADSIAAKRP